MNYNEIDLKEIAANVFQDNENILTQDIIKLLQNQLIYNEATKDIDSDVDSHKFLSNFRKMSLPILVESLREIKLSYLLNFGPVVEFNDEVESIMMKMIFIDPKIYLHNTCKTTCTNFLDCEELLVKIFGKELSMELDMFALKQIKNNAGIISCVDASITEDDGFILHMKDIMQTMRKPPNWIVASSGFVQYLSEILNFTPCTSYKPMSLGIRYIGEINIGEYGAQKLFENTFSPEYELIMGYKGIENTECKFEPRVLLDAIPNKWENSKVKQAKLRSHFNIKINNEDKNYFARISVKYP